MTRMQEPSLFLTLLLVMVMVALGASVTAVAWSPCTPMPDDPAVLCESKKLLSMSVEPVTLPK